MTYVEQPLIIAGFGRSGTTWLSDIISKYSGGLVLFEPFHPRLFEDSSKVIYSSISEKQSFIDHWNKIYSGRLRHKWLLRNHLNRPTEEVNDDFVENIWSNSQIIGFKSIRLNFNIDAFISNGAFKVLYIIRHPLSVISSILKRPNYWNDLSWNFHSNMIKDYIPSANPQTIEEKIALIWGLSVQKAYTSLLKMGIVPIFYEDLYSHPFTKAKQILNELNLYRHSIHPSHLFTPSMLSLRTMHDIFPNDIINDHKFHQRFWQDTLSKNQIDSISDMIRLICDTDENFDHLCRSRGYIF